MKIAQRALLLAAWPCTVPWPYLPSVAKVFVDREVIAADVVAFKAASSDHRLLMSAREFQRVRGKIKNARKLAHGNGWCRLKRRLLAFLVTSVMLAGCATPHPAVDPTQVDGFFPLLESDAKSFKTIALTAAPPELSGTNHVAGYGAGSSGMAGLGNLPPALGAAFLLLHFLGAQA